MAVASARPGAVEEDCLPVLESVSGLKGGSDFTVGYSQTLDIISEVYGSVVKAGIHRVPSIRVAEAAKVIENTQRDLNIAFMNELSAIFHTLGIDTGDVLTAAATKWNFLSYTPGLVGGHCIGVDPYFSPIAPRRPAIILKSFWPAGASMTAWRVGRARMRAQPDDPPLHRSAGDRAWHNVQGGRARHP